MKRFARRPQIQRAERGYSVLSSRTHTGRALASVVAVSLVALLASCGSGSHTSSPASSPAPSGPSPTAASSSAAPSGALVAQGGSLYHSLGCSSCHSLDGTPGIGPTWKGLAGSSVQLTSGQTVTADDAYLTKKIENANATTVQGYSPGVMATAIRPGSVLPADVKALVAYIQSLK